ncbi:2'-5' RNA ligase family protein [Chryseolinea sp. T2]|uniref:2'-5' RNA ligase family protein n=1 Tax=Chryseolinea sp. T2 TaxID=3129255 RepID=UPI00307795BF
MPRFAIDVVILLPPPVVDLAIAWNRRLSLLSKQSIELNNIDLLPHISLLMGCVDGHNLHAAVGLLQSVFKNTPLMTLDVMGLKFTEDSHPVAVLDIRPSSSLLALQQSLLVKLGPLMTQDATEADLYGAPPDSASAVKWINSFREEQVGLKFWPHVTLGHGRIGETQEAFSFTPDRLAICHLGKHCTCRDVLGFV